MLREHHLIVNDVVRGVRRQRAEFAGYACYRFEHMRQPACDVCGESAITCFGCGRQMAEQDDADRMQMVENRCAGLCGLLRESGDMAV